MRTRTLLLLAIGCGLAILVAGVVQLLRIAGQDEPATAAAVGAAVRVGDLIVTVESESDVGAQAVVVVELAGVDDPDGTDDFRLVIPGASLAPEPLIAPDDGPPPCAGTTVAAQRCSLVFDIGDNPGSSRILLYRRGDERARWDLGAG